MSPTISNARNSSNPDYKPKTFTSGDEEIQAVCLTDSSGSEYTQGQKTSAESSSVVFASDAPPVTITETAYISYIDDVSSSVAYYGKALPGTTTSSASWQIMKKTVSGTLTTYLYADGNASFDNVWNNRASLSYS